LPFNPGHLIQIKKLEREMKKARKAVEKQEQMPIGGLDHPVNHENPVNPV
jgi:hypothetical protein